MTSSSGQDPLTHAFANGLGPWLTPLRGKVPLLDAWQALPPITEDDAREYVEIGFNLGFRTGSRSGLVVIDDDQIKHDIPDGDQYVPPTTGLISESPTGGRHYYYRLGPDRPCPGNSAGKLAPYVDVRGEGGQVVYPGSIHPTAHQPYRWVSTDEAALLPEDVLDRLTDRTPGAITIDMSAPLPPPGNGYARTALLREVHAVRTAGDGTRNDRLNRAAFSLGQLCAGGALERADVEQQLTAAAKLAGDGEAGEDRKIAVTLRSGLNAGAKEPRTAPEPSRAPTATATATQPCTTPRSVLVPGTHVLPGGEYTKQGNHDFAASVIRALPPDVLYRRAGSVGEIQAETGFAPLSLDRIRLVVDRHVSLQAGKPPKDDGDPVLVDRTCSRDHAGLVLADATTAEEVRELRFLAAHPVCVGRDCRSAPPGWDADSGTYRLDGLDVPPLPLPEARAVLEDLICDFPFASPTDRANYFGLMLTPILRPALLEPVPMHLIGSPVERCGKTKLAEVVLGVTVTGSPIGAMQLGRDEDEHDKRITSALRAGHTIVHLDNLADALDSAPLASLLTSSVYQGRVLAQSVLVSIPNGLTVVGTGNNVHATGEIAKRIVPITLEPATESPETRSDYRHPDIKGYAVDGRLRSLGALLGLVEAWRAAGRPGGSVAFGGFERWSAVVGGIMEVAGYPEWLTNLGAWRGVADDFGAELTAFVTVWHDRWGQQWVDAGDLFKLAVEELGLFGFVEHARNDHGRRISFAKRVLNKLSGRMLPNQTRSKSDGRGARRKLCLYFAAPPENMDDMDNMDR